MIDKEQQAAPPDAISTIIKILDPLEVGDREKVLAAVRAYFQPASADETTPTTEQPQTSMIQKDIRSLKEEKQPKSDIEMAAVMAYYLSEYAGASDKRESVSADDVKIYFKQANYRLPKNAAQTLRNAKNAGYFDSTGEGRFKLNAVGHNLVTHSLPKSGSSGKPKAKRKKSPAIQNKKKHKKSPVARSKKKSKK